MKKQIKKITYSRSFIVDRSISKGIKWLNQHGFYTTGCCSGLKADHPKRERDLMYIEFEGLLTTKISQLKINARMVGFKIKKRSGIVRIETEDVLKYDMFNLFIEKLRNNEGVLNLRTMGISNWVYEAETKKYYSIQFYDYDHLICIGLKQVFIKKILEIFPLDCIMYQTKHGTQFISFALRYGLKYTKVRALEMSKELGQDFWTEAKDLTLRIAPKWNKKREEISGKPKFLGVARRPDPDTIRISSKHLEFYKKYMGLPNWVYELYSNCDKKELKFKVYHYKTRD